MLDLLEDADNIERPVRWWCPLFKEPCKLDECMWYSSDGICAIVRIAIRLDVLVEGVPIIRLFEE